jgi:hypothetical protein
MSKDIQGKSVPAISTRKDVTKDQKAGGGGGTIKSPALGTVNSPLSGGSRMDCNANNYSEKPMNISAPKSLTPGKFVGK